MHGAVAAPRQAPAGAATVWTSPESPEAGQPLRILAVAETPLDGQIFAGGTALPTVRRSCTIRSGVRATVSPPHTR